MKNANNCLQYTMDNVLEDIDEDSITYYQGQVLVHSSSYDEHLLTLKSVFSAFRCYNLKVGVEESLFLARKLVFLGKRSVLSSLILLEDRKLHDGTPYSNSFF